MDRITRLPIKYALLFLIATEVLLWLGPVDYEIKRPIVLILYLIILNYSLYLGYKRGANRARTTSLSLPLSVVQLLLVLGLFSTIYTLYVKWGARGFEISINHLINAIRDPGAAYARDDMVVFNVSILYVLVGPLQWAAIPLGIFYWKKIPVFSRIIVIATIFVNVATWIGIGTRKGILDLIIVISFLVFARNPNYINNGRLTRRIKFCGAIFIVLLSFYFVYSNLSRGGLKMSEISQYERVPCKEVYTNHLSIPVVMGLADMTSYLSGGYQLLSYGLNEGIITPTFFGSSLSTANYSVRLFGYDPLPHTYMQLIQDKYGYDKFEYWHTIYLWLANDFTFILVPLIIFLIGLYLARVWVDALGGNNAFAYPVLAYMLVMVFYFFANNQVISFNLESFIGCVLIYELSMSTQ